MTNGKKLIERGFAAPSAALAAWDSAQAAGRSKPPKRLPIHLVGLMNGGKSSLGNALLQRREHFPTGDARTTTVVTNARWKDMLLVDTPGLDATDADTQATRDAIDDLGLVVLVHGLDLGEYHRTELEFVRDLADSGIDVSRQLLLVFAKARQVSDGERVRLIARSVRLFEETVALPCPPPYTTDSTLFFKGLEERKPKLTALSGVSELASAIELQQATLRTEWSWVKRSRQLHHLRALLAQAAAERATLAEMLETQRHETARTVARLDQRLSAFLTVLDALQKLRVAS